MAGVTLSPSKLGAAFSLASPHGMLTVGVPPECVLLIPC